MFVLIKIEYTVAIYRTFASKPREEDDSLSDAEFYIASKNWHKNIFMKAIKLEAINWLNSNMKQYIIKSIETDDDENIDIYLK